MTVKLEVPSIDEIRKIGLKQIVRAARFQYEREIVLAALTETGGNLTQAAVLLRISYKAMLYKAEHARKGRS